MRNGRQQFTKLRLQAALVRVQLSLPNDSTVSPSKTFHLIEMSESGVQSGGFHMISDQCPDALNIKLQGNNLTHVTLYSIHLMSKFPSFIKYFPWVCNVVRFKSPPNCEIYIITQSTLYLPSLQQ